jgi:hypothetical protein
MYISKDNRTGNFMIINKIAYQLGGNSKNIMKLR